MARMLGVVQQDWCPLCRRTPGLDCPSAVRSKKAARAREKAAWKREAAPLSDRDLKLPHTAVQARLAPTVRCIQRGRPLHRPESRWNRIGTRCATSTERTRTYAISQDALPGT